MDLLNFLILVLIILLGLYLIHICLILTDEELVNPYNKYRIYFNPKNNKYYCSYIKSLLFPIFFIHKEYLPSGFEDYTSQTIYFDSIDEAKEAMKEEYEYYIKEKNKKRNKNKRIL